MPNFFKGMAAFNRQSHFHRKQCFYTARPALCVAFGASAWLAIVESHPTYFHLQYNNVGSNNSVHTFSEDTGGSFCLKTTEKVFLYMYIHINASTHSIHTL